MIADAATGVEYFNNNNNEILIKREPLVYTRAWRTVQKTKKKEDETEKGRTVQQQ